MEVRNEMPKMKSKILGKRIHRNKIEIVDMHKGELTPGQRVLLYQTTGKDIVAATGRVIGQKERVLGTGKVNAVGNKLIIEVPRRKINSVYKKKQPKLSSTEVAKEIHRQKPVRKDILENNTVLIKAIEE